MPVYKPLLLTSMLLPLMHGCALKALSKQEKGWPGVQGEVNVLGPAGQVTILRDELGIPHIRAGADADALFGLGFVHAQDRLFQADLTRRAVKGELSELFGERTVQIDHFAKSMQVKTLAAQVVADAPFSIQAMLQAYVAGFNAGVDSLERLPVEYQLLGIETFTPWTAEDCVGNLYLQSWNLAENPRSELAALALKDLDPALLDKVLRVNADVQPLDDYWSELRTLELGDWTPAWKGWSDAFVGIPEASQASNQWVVGPSKSADGMPIVANDPHLGQSVPSLWYTADIQGEDLHVAGVTFAGTPMVVIGHNEHVAWGLTNVMADYVDYAVVQRDGEDGYILGGERKKFREVSTVVQVKDAEPSEAVTLYTELGPVLTDRAADYLLVLQWHALNMPNEGVTAFAALNLSTSVDEALVAMSRPLPVAQNLAVADVTGDFAWQAVGSVPRRLAHTGRVPYPAYLAEHGWDGWFETLPGERAHERGYVSNANQAPDHEDANRISSHYAQGWRSGRIVELLNERDDWTPELVAEMQKDVVDTQAATHLPRLLDGVTPSLSQGKACKAILDEWDYVVSVDSIGPTVWNAFHRELLREALVDELGEAGLDVLMQVQPTSRNMLGVGLEPYMDEDTVENALTAACMSLENTLGEEVAGWTWGSQHPLKLQHPIGRTSSLLSRWNMPVTPFPGNSVTLAAASASWSEGEKAVGGMASVRVVMPLSDLSKSTMVYPGGQSGHPRHAHSQDQFPVFVAGETLPLYFSDQDVLLHAVNRLTLIPTYKSGAEPVVEPPVEPLAETPEPNPSGDESPEAETAPEGEAEAAPEAGTEAAPETEAETEAAPETEATPEAASEAEPSTP